MNGRASLAADDGERRNFHRSARACPPRSDTPGTSPATTTPQVTALLHDFAVSLGVKPSGEDIGAGNPASRVQYQFAPQSKAGDLGPEGMAGHPQAAR
jgi:hypothetical protein